MKGTETKSTHNQQHQSAETAFLGHQKEDAFFSAFNSEQTAFFQPSGSPNVQTQSATETNSFFQPSRVPSVQPKCEACETEEQKSEFQDETPDMQMMAAFGSHREIENTSFVQQMPAFESEEGAVQTKLTLGQPGDKYEQEADFMASRVMTMPEPGISENENIPINLDIQSSSLLKNNGQSHQGSEKKDALQAKKQNGHTTFKTASLETRLNTSKGKGEPLPQETRTFMEARFGQDFSTVQVHNGSEAAQMNQELGAQAFTHQQDVYFGSGKYSPESDSGKRLLAHELTHVVQQGDGNSLNRKPSKNDNNESQRTTPNVQAAWYNVNIPFTDYQFDPSIQGVKNAAGIARDTVEDAAGAVRDAAVSAFEWVVDLISNLISSGIDWLNSKFSEIKEFATSSFNVIKNGLGGLLGLIVSPMSLITTAFSMMNADLLEAAWDNLKNVTLLVWQGIRATIDGVLQIGEGLWSAASGFVSSLFNRVESLFDNFAFRQLPSSLQQSARNLFGRVRALWQSIRDFITNLLERLRSYAREILDSIEAFFQQIISYGIEKVLAVVRKIKEVWAFIQRVAADPIGFIQPIIDGIAAKINAEAPPKAIEVGRQKSAEAFQNSQSSASSNGTIQRQTESSEEERSTASRDEVNTGFESAIRDAWSKLDIGKMLLETIEVMFWPPATIRAIGNEFYELWVTDWANAASNLFAPRNPLESFWGFLHDVWSNFLVLLDFPLALWRRLNHVVMSLLGYLTIILVLVGLIGGAIAGGGALSLPGAVAGAKAGFALSVAIGAAAMFSYIGAEAITYLKIALELYTARQTQSEKNRDYVQLAASALGIGIALALVLVFWLLARFVTAVVQAIRGRGGGPPVAEPVRVPPEEEPRVPREEEPQRPRVVDPYSELGARWGLPEEVINILREKGVRIEAVERLLEAGIDHTNLGLYADEFGASGIQAIDNLVRDGSAVRAALQTIDLAQGIPEARLVIDLINSGRLSNLRGLRNFLREVAQELTQGQTGKYDQLIEASRRASEGHSVSLEGRARAPGDPESGQADIVDHTSREAIQMKTVRTGATDLRTAGDALTRNVQSAVDQLGGAGGEVPPSGYRLIAWVRVLAESNPFSRMTRAEILNALRGQINNLNVLNPPSTSAGEVRITNNRGTFSYNPGEL